MLDINVLVPSLNAHKLGRIGAPNATSCGLEGKRNGDESGVAFCEEDCGQQMKADKAYANHTSRADHGLDARYDSVYFHMVEGRRRAPW